MKTAFCENIVLPTNLINILEESKCSSEEFSDQSCSIQLLKQADFEDPSVNFHFNNPFFLRRADCNIVANLLRGYSYVDKSSDFIRENDWEVPKHYHLRNNAPQDIVSNFSHSDVLLAFLSRLENEVRTRQWNGQSIARFNVTSRNLNLDNISIEFI